jgi:ribonuclease VapC
MVLDSSVVVAIMQHEEGYELLISRMGEAETREISAVSYMEASMVLITRRGDGVEADIDRMLYEAKVAIIPVSVTHAKLLARHFVDLAKGDLRRD